MSGSEDLKAHAASNQDFYALLDLQPLANEAEIRRAYRRTALKYHPDKIASPTQQDLDKFHLLQIANDVLSDPAIRQLYDNAREARMRKQRERDLMDAAKRKMRDDLEARERAGAAAAAAGGTGQQGTKRSWASAGDDDAEAKLQQEIARIAEDGRNRRREAAEKLKRELDEEQKIIDAEEEEARRAADRSSQRVDRSQDAQVSELDRSVKVRWEREGRGLDLDGEWLAGLFAPFGKVENTLMLKDKRVRVEGKRSKVTFATGVIVFASIVSAHAAVVDGEQNIRRADGDWALVESVSWASGQKPDLAHAGQAQTDSPASSGSPEPTPAPQPTEPSKPSFSFPGLNSAPKSGKAPSFGSFASAASKDAPKASSFNPSAKASGTPSLEEMTLMRLKNAQREKERRALEEQLAKEDEAADAEEAAAKTNGN